MSQFVQPSRAGDRAEKHGIVCPECGGKTSVYYTRNGPGEKILRVRECKTCGARVQTYEIVVGGRVSIEAS